MALSGHSSDTSQCPLSADVSFVIAVASSALGVKPSVDLNGMQYFLRSASGVPNSLQAVQGSPATPDRAQYRTTEPPDLDRHPAATGTGRVPIWIAPARSPAPTWSDTPGKCGGKAHSEGRTPTPSASGQPPHPPRQPPPCQPPPCQPPAQRASALLGAKAKRLATSEILAKNFMSFDIAAPLKHAVRVFPR